MMVALQWRLTGRHVLLAFVGFFSIVLTANLFLVWAALESWTGLETTSAYRAGQLYNREAAMARAQGALGWQVSASVRALPDGRARIVVTARDEGARPLGGLTVHALLRRPVGVAETRALLPEVDPGRYAASVPNVAEGQWDLRIEARDLGGRTYRLEDRLVLRHEGDAIDGGPEP